MKRINKAKKERKKERKENRGLCREQREEAKRDNDIGES